MSIKMTQKIKYLIVDTTAFINNASLHEIAENIITVQEVVDEIINKRQLKRLIVLPYDLVIKDVFSENVKLITDFSKKTGDYPSLSATDIKVMALTYQLEKEQVGTAHLKEQPCLSKTFVTFNNKPKEELAGNANVAGFYLPGKQQDKYDNDEDLQKEVEHENLKNDIETDSKANEPDLSEIDKKLSEKFSALECDELEIDENDVNDVLTVLDDTSDYNESEDEESDSDDESSWITPSNLKSVKKQLDSDLVEDKPIIVGCITTDFAMQNVLKQMGLHVVALDGRVIKQLRTFILRCHTCFATTSRMEKVFCPKCGNNTLKKVAVSVDADGNQHIHINARKCITARGKKFSLPTFKGGKHSNNPILTEDQPQPQQRPSRQAKIKNNPLDPDYTASFSPFVMRDVNSRSALLGIRSDVELKHWMQKNPNESRRRRKK